MYKIEDFVMYGSEGVCRVTDICSPEISGIEKGRLYYILEPVYKNGKIYAPVDTSKSMRSVMTQEQAQVMIDAIPSVTSEKVIENNFEQEAHYKQLLRTHDCSNLMKLIKTLLTKKSEALSHSKKFCMTDESYLEKAEEMLFSEFATALNKPMDSIKRFVEEQISCPESTGNAI